LDNKNLYMVIDIDKCWGCMACRVACKQEHDMPAESSGNIDVVKIEQKDENGRLHCDFVPVMCQHCSSPACLEACPANAISKNEEQLVCIDQECCIGCGSCFDACPYGCVSLQAAAAGEKAQKCDLCISRREKGFLPSCEQHCLGGAFKSCHEEKMQELIRERYHYQTGSIVYVSSKLADLGKHLKLFAAGN